MSRHSLSSLFEPTSVAVVGASSDAERIGGRVLRFLLESGYAGRIYPVNKSGLAEVQGLPAIAALVAVWFR